MHAVQKEIILLVPFYPSFSTRHSHSLSSLHFLPPMWRSFTASKSISWPGSGRRPVTLDRKRRKKYGYKFVINCMWNSKQYFIPSGWFSTAPNITLRCMYQVYASKLVIHQKKRIWCSATAGIQNVWSSNYLR